MLQDISEFSHWAGTWCFWCVFLHEVVYVLVILVNWLLILMIDFILVNLWIWIKFIFWLFLGWTCFRFLFNSLKSFQWSFSWVLTWSVMWSLLGTVKRIKVTLVRSRTQSLITGNALKSNTLIPTIYPFMPFMSFMLFILLRFLGWLLRRHHWTLLAVLIRRLWFLNLWHLNSCCFHSRWCWFSSG